MKQIKIKENKPVFFLHKNCMVTKSFWSCFGLRSNVLLILNYKMQLLFNYNYYFVRVKTLKICLPTTTEVNSQPYYKVYILKISMSVTIISSFHISILRKDFAYQVIFTHKQRFKRNALLISNLYYIIKE